MECMTDINIIDFLDKHDGSIMCFLTFGTMIFAAVTAYIANQKRKDDLFKIRWECYQEILNKLQTNYSLYNTNFFEQIDNMQKVGHEMPTGQYLENIFTSHHYFISQVRWLFNDEIADIVQKLLISKSTLSSRKNLKKKEYYSHYLDVIEYEHYNQNIQKFEKAKMVNPTLEFTKKFDNYLKLK